jgi:hypothetical protein
MTMPKAAILRAAAALAALLALASCLSGGNSGSETTNGLTGTVRDPGGNPVSGGVVLLLETNHNGALPEGAVGPLETATDAKGVYRFRDVEPGEYNLEITDPASGNMAWIPGVRIAAEGIGESDGALRRPGSVEIPVPDFLAGGRPGYLHIPGTTRFVRADAAAREAGVLVLEPLAAGAYPALHLVVEENDQEPVVIAEGVEVEPGGRTRPHPYASWAHERRIPVTPPSGTGLAGVVRGFPLLVRLDAGGFDFAQASSDGRDVRFAGPSGNPLPLEIERWDRTAGLAEVWVRVDSVAWSGEAQYVTMHWGRDGAVPVSSGPAVFAGHATVYHLAEAANEDPGGYRDASPGGNHATARGINKTALLEGVAGMGKSFVGELGSLTAAVPAGIGGDSGFTVSFWMKASPDTGRTSILDFGGRSRLAGFHFLIRPDTTSQFGAFDSSANAVASWQNVFPIGPYMGRWTHVATAYDPARRKTSTYMDGRPVDESDMPAEGFRLDAAAGLRIGSAVLEPGPYRDLPFNGQLDEIRFHAGVLDEARIRLDYETQKPR